MSDEVKREYNIGEYAIKPCESEDARDSEMISEDLRWAVKWAEGMSFMWGFTLVLLLLTWYGVI